MKLEHGFFSELQNNNELTSEIRVYAAELDKTNQILGPWDEYETYLNENLFEPWLITKNVNIFGKVIEAGTMTSKPSSCAEMIQHLSLSSDEYYYTVKTEDQFDDFWHNYIKISHHQSEHDCNITCDLSLFNRIVEYMCDVNFQLTQSHMLSNLDIQLLNQRKAVHKSIFNRPESFFISNMSQLY